MRGSSIKEKKNNEYLWITKGLSHFSDFRSATGPYGIQQKTGRNSRGSPVRFFRSSDSVHLVSIARTASPSAPTGTGVPQVLAGEGVKLRDTSFSPSRTRAVMSSS